MRAGAVKKEWVPLRHLLGGDPQRDPTPMYPIFECNLDLISGTKFVDGNWSTLARILPYVAGGTAFNVLNFNISPVLNTTGAGAMPWIPYRDKSTRVNGLLKQGSTRIARATDGLSNTIAVGEDAGRDPRYLSHYLENQYNSVTTLQAYLAATNPNDLGPADGFTAERRSWRWAEPDAAFGISGTPNSRRARRGEGRSSFRRAA